MLLAGSESECVRKILYFMILKFVFSLRSANCNNFRFSIHLTRKFALKMDETCSPYKLVDIGANLTSKSFNNRELDDVIERSKAAGKFFV